MTDNRKIPRTAKGKRPQYFDDPACDGLHYMLMALVEELSVTRDRLDALERVLEHQGVTSAAAIDRYAPTDAEELARDERRAAYVRRITKFFADQVGQSERPDPAMEFENVVKIMRD